MTSRERINKILNFEIPDRIGVWDHFCDGVFEDIHREEYFDYDIKLVDSNRPGNGKFTAFSIQDPFQRACKAFGLEHTLKKMAWHPEDMLDWFENEADKIISGRYSADGIWLWSDIAYSGGLLFSTELYEKTLFPAHRRICQFFDSIGMPVIFHSDGDIRNIIPRLVDIRVRALHPLENMDMPWLKKEYGKDVVLFGNIQFDGDVRKQIELAKEGGGYIYSLKGPVGNDINIEDYKKHIDVIKDTGRYGGN